MGVRGSFPINKDKPVMNMFEEPAWVADHDTWAKAKKAAGKSGPDNIYALTTAIYKKMGGKIKKAAAEADSASSFPAAVRPGVKKESAKLTIRSVRIREAAQNDDGKGTNFRTVLIEEGLGNFGDCFYYTKEALKSAVPVFEGKKIFANHPSTDEEQNRPERSVNDILGYFENLGYEETEDGRGQLVGDVNVMEEAAYQRALMKHAVDYAKKFPDKDFVGLSINASGDAMATSLDEFMKENEIPESALPKMAEAKEQGIEQIKVVSNINEAVSCDLVTEAGAGGKVLKLIEEEKRIMAKKEKLKVKEGEEKFGKPEDKATPEQPAAASADGAGHDDAEQDKELIKKVMSQLGGKEAEADESDEAMVRQAMKCAKEMGYEGEEAASAVGTYVKMAKHMASKQAEAGESESEGEETEAEAEEKQAPGMNETESENQEAKVLRAQVTKLMGEVAALTEKEKRAKLAQYLDTKLAESKLPRSATDKFRETIELPRVRDEKQIDAQLKVFVEGWNSHREMPGLSLSDLMLSPEKSVSEGKSSLDLSDCVQ